jgi:hypothetical protein
VTVVDLQRPTGRRRTPPRPFTVEHFRIYCSRLVFDDGERRDPEPWQLDYAHDVFKRDPTDRRPLQKGRLRRPAYKTGWLIVPEGNGKTTFMGELGLYGCDWTWRPWVPVGASGKDQAKKVYVQAKGFVHDTPGMRRRFRCFDGYRQIKPLGKDGKERGGEGLVICPWDPDSNDGAIPYPYYICDELHRHPDMSLWRLWEGKLRKRGGQGLGISTAGEPGSDFEEARDAMRHQCQRRRRARGGTRHYGRRAFMHEYMLEDAEKAKDPKAVAKVNPLSTVTEETIAEDLASPTLDLGEFKRLKCNIPARSSLAAISDEEWSGARSTLDAIPAGERIDAGYDSAWKLDTAAVTPCWDATAERLAALGLESAMEPCLLLDEALVEVPPRDGSSMHPDKVKAMFYKLRERHPIDSVSMDTSDAEDIASWLADELGLIVIDRPQSNDLHVLDYKNFMRGLRNCQPSRFPLAKAGKDEAKHTTPVRHVRQCPLLTRHAMNAIGRRLPRGQLRFDRPSQSRSASKQDTRVIDALTAAGMVVTHSIKPPKKTVDMSAYRMRRL